MAVMEEQGQSNRPRVERSGRVSPVTRYWKAIHYRDSFRGRTFPALTIEEIKEDIRVNHEIPEGQIETAKRKMRHISLMVRRSMAEKRRECLESRKNGIYDGVKRRYWKNE